MSKYNYTNLFILKKDIPGFEAGTIFQLREYNAERNLGNREHGYLTNIWIEGDCQDSKDYAGWVAGTHIFPGQLHENRDWFAPVKMIGKAEKPNIHEVKGLLFEEDTPND
jgi:hypothetical protein